MNTLENAIANHPFTKDLNPRYLHLLTGCATYERFGVEQQIFQEGLEADRFYLLHSGRVALQTFVPRKGAVTIETISGGEVLGWSWLFPPYRWHFSALSLEPTEAVALCARTLREEMEENHDFGYAITTRVSRIILERLQATRVRMLELYNPPI